MTFCVCVQVLRDVDRESASTVALAGSIGNAGQRLEVQADMESAQRLSISSLSDKSANISLADDGAASTRALAGSVFNYKVFICWSLSQVVNSVVILITFGKIKALQMYLAIILYW